MYTERRNSQNTRISIKWECEDCGNIITVPEDETPTICFCGGEYEETGTTVQENIY